jgi:hypothetical protein
MDSGWIDPAIGMRGLPYVKFEEGLAHSRDTSCNTEQITDYKLELYNLRNGPSLYVRLYTLYYSCT